MGKVIETFVIVFVLWGIRKILLRFVDRRTERPKTLFFWRKFSSYFSVGFGILMIWIVWAENISSSDIAAYLGLLSAGLAIALQDPISNFTGWLFIIFRRPLEIGDRIEINNHAGDVVDTHFFQFTMLEVNGWVDADQSTGRVLHIPNKFVFSYAIANFTKGFSLIWNELPLQVTFESDWRKAKSIMLAIAKNHTPDFTESATDKMRGAARQYGIKYSNLEATVYTKVEQYGVELTLRYLCEPRQRRNSAQVLWEEILDQFSEQEDIDFAYPTQRLFYNPTEGKSAETKTNLPPAP